MHNETSIDVSKGLSLRVVVILAACAALAGCASDVVVVSSGDRYAVAGGIEDYKLGPGDRIRLTVYNEPTMTGLYQVSAQGRLSLPLVGDINATGRTPTEVAAIVQDKLAGGFLQNPRVNAEVSDYRPFFILGEVVQGGQFPYVPGMTAMAAVATARGYTPRSQRKFIYIRREGAQEEVAYRVTPGLRIYPGDTIRVEERWF